MNNGELGYQLIDRSSTGEWRSDRSFFGLWEEGDTRVTKRPVERQPHARGPL